MNRDILDINDFTVLVEEAVADTATIDTCAFDEPVIGVAFYGSGDVELDVKYGSKKRSFTHTKGIALSFYADDQTEFIHTVAPDKPLQCIVIVTAIKNLQKLPNQEGEIFMEMLDQLVNPQDSYVEGPHFHMTPDMQHSVEKMFNTRYEGKTKMMFFRSQMTALLSHFFGELAGMKEEVVKEADREKLYEAKEILLSNIDNPPSLNELSKQIGLNSNKLKKNFKELFGVPVFKYLQNERLNMAHDLLRNQDMSIQQAAWHVGYDSLSSFSNAFTKKYGFRPSEIRS
ncbi:MAG: AraC family transcriptional regulator [Cyclobacteriaceae bacterium]